MLARLRQLPWLSMLGPLSAFVGALCGNALLGSVLKGVYVVVEDQQLYGFIFRIRLLSSIVVTAIWFLAGFYLCPLMKGSTRMWLVFALVFQGGAVLANCVMSAPMPNVSRIGRCLVETICLGALPVAGSGIGSWMGLRFWGCRVVGGVADK